MSQIKEKIGKFSFVDTAAGQYALHMDWSHSMSPRCRNCSTSAGGTGTMTR